MNGKVCRLFPNNLEENPPMDATQKVIEEKLNSAEQAVFSCIMAIAQLFGWVLAATAYLCSPSVWDSPQANKAIFPIKKAIHAFWYWLECPAPGQLTVPVEDPNSLSSKIVQALGYAILGLAIAGFIYIWVFYPAR